MPSLRLTYYFLASLLSTYLTGVFCEEVDCKSLAAKGKCHSDVKYMAEHCKPECQNWQQEKYKFKGYFLSKGKSFYDLTLTSSTGKTVDFERFEGYVPIFIPMAKTCSGSKVEPASLFEAVEDLHSVFPYSVEVLVFPFEHPSVDYSEKNCEDFEKECTKPGRKINVMALSDLTGPDANPAFQLISQIMGPDQLNLNTTAYFVVHPDLTKFEYHYGKSLDDMKDTLAQWVKVLDGGEREL